MELEGTKVLVVDDEDDARALLNELLGRAGCTVTTAASASEAFDLLDELEPHVVISDIGMPDEDGYSLMRRIRARSRSRGGNVPSIALTAYTSAVDRMKAFQAGYSSHLPKPVRSGELLKVLHALSRGR
jgi:CheY-like chemotaxis protein